MPLPLPIGVTLGDPAGIGPELVVRALHARPVADAPLRVFGDRRALELAARAIGLPLPSDFTLVEVTQLGQLVPGQPTEATGRAQVAYLEAAVKEARTGTLKALCTAPIHKGSCRAAGFAFPGHTEFLAERLGAGRVTMMLAGPRLRVALVTTHVSLAEVSSRLSVEAVTQTILHAAEALGRDFGIAWPRIAVAGLNPHAGEGGHFGDEEARIITPAIAAAREQLGDEVEVAGPLVPDAVFRQAARGIGPDGARYDAVVAMYHDQGLIPLKLIDFDEAVNVTLGLPVVRTSPDHGVAYDLAGRGLARTTSFYAALRLAHHLATCRFSSLA